MNLQHKRLILQPPKKSYLYNLRNGLKNWHTLYNSIKEGSTTIGNILLLGDSIGEGYSAGTTTNELMTYGFAPQTNTYFSTIFHDVGRGFIPSWYPWTSKYCTQSGTWEFTNMGFMSSSYCSTTNGSTITFNFNGTGIELWFSQMYTGGNFTVTIDAGDPQTFNNGGGYTYPLKFNISDLETGDHTCTITCLGKRIDFSGFIEKKGSSGIRLHQGSRTGGKTEYAVTNQNLSCMASLDADLTIIALGVNDYAEQLSLSTFESRMNTIIDQGLTTGDVLLVSEPPKTNLTIPYTSYRDVMRNIAYNKGVGLFDVHDFWHGGANANGLGYMSDNVHWSRAGHTVIATMLGKIISGEI